MTTTEPPGTPPDAPIVPLLQRRVIIAACAQLTFPAALAAPYLLTGFLTPGWEGDTLRFGLPYALTGAILLAVGLAGPQRQKRGHAIGWIGVSLKGAAVLNLLSGMCVLVLATDRTSLALAPSAVLWKAILISFAHFATALFGYAVGDDQMIRAKAAAAAKAAAVPPPTQPPDA